MKQAKDCFAAGPFPLNGPPAKLYTCWEMFDLSSEHDREE
jgi:hypothetical protein